MLGTIGLGAFVASMTLGHSFADPSSPGTAGSDHPRSNDPCHRGVLLFVVSLTAPLALAGVLLWGVVASIGYCAFLGGPPLIGYLRPNSPFGKPLSRLLSQSGNSGHRIPAAPS